MFCLFFFFFPDQNFDQHCTEYQWSLMINTQNESQPTLWYQRLMSSKWRRTTGSRWHCDITQPGTLPGATTPESEIAIRLIEGNSCSFSPFLANTPATAMIQKLQNVRKQYKLEFRSQPCTPGTVYLNHVFICTRCTNVCTTRWPPMAWPWTSACSALSTPRTKKLVVWRLETRNHTRYSSTHAHEYKNPLSPQSCCPIIERSYQ